MRDARCVACHTAVSAGAEQLDLAADDKRAGATATINPAILADGVGCEACHGPAERWLGEHTKATWLALGDARYSPAWGMRDTPNLRVRAETCVGCHVGAPAQRSEPARDVNHDLLAAGHPRLNFEFSAYLANLPRHWDARADRRRYPDYEARAWSVGQIVSLQAALELLADRARQAQIPPTPENRDVKPVWPDFSEFRCYSCHHELRSESGRRRPPAKRPQETVSWCSWYGSAMFWWPAADVDSVLQLGTVAGAMSQPLPSATKVQSLAVQAAREFSTLAPATERMPLEPARLKLLMLDIVEGRPFLPFHWDESCQAYLALAAFNAARRDIATGSSGHAQANQPQIDVALEKVRRSLEFPSTADAGKTPHDVAIHFDSPSNFDPEKFHAALGELKAALESEEH